MRNLRLREGEWLVWIDIVIIYSLCRWYWARTAETEKDFHLEPDIQEQILSSNKYLLSHFVKSLSFGWGNKLHIRIIVAQGSVCSDTQDYRIYIVGQGSPIWSDLSSSGNEFSPC